MLRIARNALVACATATLHVAVARAEPAAPADAGVPPLPESAPAASVSDGADTAIHPPELTTFVDAEYPPAAVAARQEGDVLLELSIDAEGNVTDARVSQPAGAGFDEAARAAAVRFRFRPAQRGTRRVAARITYRYSFRLPAEQEVAASEPLDPVLPAPGAMPLAASVNSEPAALQVTVLSLSDAERLRQSSRAIKVIELGAARRRTADLGEVLARTEGVAVQRSGGLGSETRLSLHGLTDDQVRVFLDGVPIELSGFGFGIASVPLDWVGRVEVYRGVVPLALGADALGGALDLVLTRPPRRASGSLSYAAGAFDTHQVAGNVSAYHAPSGIALRAHAFFDTSRNDYLVRVRVPNDLGQLSDANVRRFHDAYLGRGASLEASVVERSWTERLSLRLYGTAFDKDLQHNANMTVPYGEVTYGEQTLGGVLRYDTPEAPARRWHFGAMAAHAYRSLDFRDVSRWVYDWFGNRIFERNPGAGETSPFARDLTQWEHRTALRGTLTYDVAARQFLRLVLAPDVTVRTGRERLRVNPERLDPLTTKRELLQMVGGLEHGWSDAADVFENDAFLKGYLYGPSTDQVRTFDNSIEHVEDTLWRGGIGNAFRARITQDIAAKASYEYATRLPRPDELFGDGVLLLPNLELVPESSHNANLSVLFDLTLGAGLGRLGGEVAGFARYTDNMVVRMLAEDRVHSIHQNVFDVRTLGTDGALRWSSPGRLLGLQLNGTFQDQRNDSEQGPFTPFRGDRVPNRPWLFANAAADVHVPGVGSERADLGLSWVTRYVHEFLPGWAGTGAADTRDRIPDQLVHSLSVTYSASGPNRVDVALDLTNITDAEVFDVLGVQKPGRAAFFKISICGACAAN
jgi:TonB family protein